VPNFGHWYVRGRVGAGRFDYDRRGILDRRHLRFFTRPSAARTFAASGLEVRHVDAVGVPMDLLAHRANGEQRGSRGTRAVHQLDRLGITAAPTLFAYQFLFELTPSA
jgi:hypothetical protein